MEIFVLLSRVNNFLPLIFIPLFAKGSLKLGKLSTGKQIRLNLELSEEIFNLFSLCKENKTSELDGYFFKISYKTVAEVVVLHSFSGLKSEISSKKTRSKSVATTFSLSFLISSNTLDKIGNVFFLSIMLCAIDSDLRSTSRFI